MSTVESKRYWCYVDVCEEGKHFCDHKQLRCTYCSRVAENCFTHLHERNCTQYCNEMLMVKPDVQNDSVEWIPHIGWALLILVLVLVLITFLLDKFCCNHKLLDKLKSITCCRANVNSTMTRSRANIQDDGIEYNREEGEGGESFDPLVGNPVNDEQSDEDTTSVRTTRLASIQTAKPEIALASVYVEPSGKSPHGNTTDKQTGNLEQNPDRPNTSAAGGRRGSHDTNLEPRVQHRNMETRGNMNNGCAALREAQENSSHESVVRAELASNAVSISGEHAISYQSPRVDSGLGPSEDQSITGMKERHNREGR